MELISFLFFAISCGVLVYRKDLRNKSPENIQLMSAFILGLALFLTNLLNEWDHLTWMLLLCALSFGTFSVFAGSMICKKTEDLDAYLKYSSLAGAGVLCVVLPLSLAVFFGKDFKSMWVIVTVLFSLLVSFYTYYDIVIFHDRIMYQENDYMLSALYVYIDFLWIVFNYGIKPCIAKGHELMSGQQYQEQNDERV